MYDANKADLEEELAKIKANPNKERASDLNYFIKHVRQKGDEKILKKIIKKLAESGFTIPDLKKLRDMDWVSTSLPIGMLFLYTRELGLSNKDIKKIGSQAVAMNTLNRFFIRYFVSLKSMFNRMDHTWKLHYTLGGIELVNFSEKEKKAVVKIKGVLIHPLDRLFVQGVYTQVLTIASGSNKVKIEEIEVHEDEGDVCYTWNFSW